MPSMETSVALEVCQVRVADCPVCTVSGLTEIEAVGDAGGGGGGGGGGAAFFAQAPSMRIVARAMTVVNTFKPCCCFMFFLFTFDPPANSEILSKFQRSVLFPTPVWLRVASCKSQLVQLGAVGEHHPDFFLPGAHGLKNDVAAVRRPRRRIVTPAVVRELNPLFAGDIHQINVRRTGLAWSILTNPRQRQELSIRRPVGRDRVALVGHALLVGAVSFNGVDLR